MPDNPRYRFAITTVLLVFAICGRLRAQAPGLMGSDVDSSVRMPLLMPDDFSDMHLTAWRVERGTLDENNPLLVGDMPWDAGGVGIHGSVFKDPLDSRWKAYLVGTPPEFHEVKPWASNNHGYRRLCLYESADGIHWTRPELSIVPMEGHESTNILFDILAVYPSLFVDPDNAEWPYEMFVLHENSALGPAPEGNGFYRYRSRDGKQWDLLGKVKGLMTGDLGMVQRNLEEDGYACYFRLAGPRQPNDHLPLWEDAPRRTCLRATSQDGDTWIKDPAMILTADERDHRDTQYQELVPVKVDGGYLAMVTMYHPITQTLNLRMAASRDGRNWWFPDRVPCLDNPPLGDYGGGMIWQSQNLIVQDESLYVYFGGSEGPHRQIFDTRAPSIEIGPMEKAIDHGAHFIPFNSALCRASWRFDRMYALVSSAGGPTVGAATTKPKQLSGSELWVNVKTHSAKHPGMKHYHEGYLQVELLDERGNPLAGFAKDDCTPIQGDHQAIRVAWKGGNVAPAGARQARFCLRRAMLYGFEFRNLDKAGATAENQSASEAIQLRPYSWGGPYAEMRAKYACPHDDGLCAEVRAPWLEEGERLILRAAEIVGFDSGYFYDDHFPTQEQQGRGKDYQHVSFQWNTENAPQELSARCRVPGKGQFQLRLTARKDYIDIALSVRNDMDRPISYVDWYFCPVTYEAPSLHNRSLDRTYLFDGSRMLSLAQIGQPSETMYPVAGDRGSGGFIPPLHASHARGAVQAAAPLVVVENQQRSHAMGLAFERAHSIFASAGNGCCHADPFFGHDLQPGEEREVLGRLYLVQGSAEDVLARFQVDFPPER